MGSDSVYKAVLLDHFHNPRNKGDVDGMEMVRRGSNPRCGDEIDVGISCADKVLKSVRFRGRGCSICLASASIMSECATGMGIQQARQLIVKMQQWFSDSHDDSPPSEQVAALGSLRQHPARKKCVLLAWMALNEGLNGIEEQNG